MKKLLSVVLAMAIIASCFTMITIFADQTAPASTTATTVVNGDAESTGGWINGHLGGTTTIIEEPGNTSNHVAKATITGQYHTIGYDLTPAIVQDAAKGYAGGGAGNYILSFRYKTTDAANTGKYQVYMTSKAHMQKANVTTLLGADAYATDGYFQGTPATITMTGEWQTYTGVFTVSQQYLDMIKACEAAGKTDAGKLTIRLCGANDPYKSGTYFDYYLDDLTIERQPDAKGVKFEVTEDFDASNGYAYYRISTPTLTKDMAVDGKIVKTFTFHNVSDVALRIEAQYQNGWNSVGVSSLVSGQEIPAGEKKDFVLTVPCDANGNVTDSVALSALTLRFNLMPVERNLKIGDAVIVEVGNNSEVAAITSGTRQNGTTGKAVATPVYTLPSGVVGYEIKKTGTDVVNYLTTGTNGGVFTTADIKDGKLTKTYTIYNPNDYEVNAELCLQATLRKIDDSGAAWVGRGISKNIPAKSSAEFTVSLDESTTTPGKIHFAANAGNNTAEQDVDVTKVFLRLNVKKAAENKVVQNLTVVVAAAKDDVVSKLQSAGFTNTAVDKLPEVVVTPTPSVTATPVPVVKGLQYTGVVKAYSENGTAAVYPVAGTGKFTAEDVVWDTASTGDGTEYTTQTGTITRTYNVYNTSDVAIRAGITLYGGNRMASDTATSPVVGWDVPAGTTGHAKHTDDAMPAQSVRQQVITFPVYLLKDGTVAIKDTKSAITIDGEKVKGYALLSTVQLRFDFWDFDVNASVVIAPAETNENDEIFGLGNAVKSSVTYATKTLVYELPNIAVATPTPTAAPTATPTPTAVPVKTVVNGDAENGNTGWAAKMGGSTTIVTDPDDANNKVAMFVPNTSQYSTINFDISAAILQDAAKGYAGGGAGKYAITFRAKAEEGKGGTFTGLINSELHRNKNDEVNGYVMTEATYKSGTGFNMTDEWATYTVTVTLTEAFMENIYNCYAANAANAYVYKLYLRLDASNGRAFTDGTFTYYLDDVTIEKVVEGTPTPTATATATATAGTTPTPTPAATTYVGTKFEVTEDITDGYAYFRNGNAGITEADVVDGVVTKTFEVYNTGDIEIPVFIYYQSGWSTIGNQTAPGVNVLPKAKAIVTVSFKVDENNMVKVGNNTAALSTLSLRVDLGNKAANYPAGTSFIVAATSANDPILAMTKGAKQPSTAAGKVTSYQVTELPDYVVATPTPTPAPTPVVDKEVVNGDAENGKTGWAANNGGSVNAIVDPDNADNHIIEFVPNTSIYSTANFNLSAAILQDAANGYVGGGAGRYIVTFRAKAEEGKGGAFTFVLNSKLHKNKGDNINGYTATEPTYYSGPGFNMTDEWATYTITLDVKESFLKNIYDCYAANTANSSVYDLYLRFDGSGSRAFKDGTFKYYIDDVTIQLTAPATPEPTPVGVKFESTEVISGDHYITSSASVFANEPGFTGKKTLTYTFYNTSTDQNAYIWFGYNVTHKTSSGSNTWAEAGKGMGMTILPERKVTLTAELDVKDGLVTVTNGGVTTQYTLDKFFLRFNIKFPGAADANDSVIIAGNSDTDIIYNIKSGYKLTATKVAELPDYIEASKADTAPKKENGNAEKGLVNWGNIHGGKIQLAQPGAAGTGNAVKLVPSGTGKYQSIAFDLGPWIIYDKAEGYLGGGPGKYEVTFYAKGDKAGKFSVMLNSQLHLGKADVAKAIGSGAAAGDTWRGGGSIDMTKGWKKYTVTFDVTADWYKQMLRLYDSNHAKAAMAYQLALRFDGANGAFKNGVYSYQIDQVSVKKVSSYSLATVTGVELELKEDTTGSTYLKTNTGVLTSSMIKDGEITKEFEITNTGTETIKVYFTMQATVTVDGKASWKAPNSGETIEIEPGATETVSFTMEVNDDKTVSIGDVDVTLDKFFYRFDLKNEDNGNELVAGTKFKIVAVSSADYKAVSQLTSSQSKYWTISPVYSKSSKTETGDVLPVAMLATVAFAFVGLAVVVVAKKKRKED